MTNDDLLFAAAENGDVPSLVSFLDANPDKLSARMDPYGWTLLHIAASKGHIGAVDALIARGSDVNAREVGDNTYAMHWAAAAGHLDIVKRLADAGGDVIGAGDDHELEIIGWATCWEGCDDPPHRAVADFLISRGARHHIFSAIASNLPDEVRRIFGETPAALNARMSRNENHQSPLHFAVRMNRPDMVALLVELGADPLVTDNSGLPPAAHATHPDVDLALMARLRTMTSAELLSAERGHRAPRLEMLDLAAAVALGDFELADRLLRSEPQLADSGVLHLMAKRNDVRGLDWLLAHGADPNVRWAHWDSEVTPLHLATLAGHAEAVKHLLAAGADPGMRDTKHDSDAAGWADFFGRRNIGDLLTAGTDPA